MSPPANPEARPLPGTRAGDAAADLESSRAPQRAVGTDVGGYVVVGASVAGRSHAARGRPRDDAFAVRCAGPWLAIAVSDGVGSQVDSRAGSTCAVESLVEHLIRRAVPAGAEIEWQWSPTGWLEFAPPGVFGYVIDRPIPSIPVPTPRFRPMGLLQALSAPRALPPPARLQIAPAARDLLDAMRSAFHLARRDLARRAAELHRPTRSLACTALAVLLNTDTGECAAGQVGDGAIVTVSDQDELQSLVSPPLPADPGVTSTLAGGDLSAWLAVGSCAAPAAVLLMTDGVAEDVLAQSPDATNRWVQAVTRHVVGSAAPVAARGLSTWLDSYHVPGSFDDRTLVAVVRKEGALAHGPSA